MAVCCMFLLARAAPHLQPSLPSLSQHQWRAAWLLSLIKRQLRHAGGVCVGTRSNLVATTEHWEDIRYSVFAVHYMHLRSVILMWVCTEKYSISCYKTAPTDVTRNLTWKSSLLTHYPTHWGLLLADTIDRMKKTLSLCYYNNYGRQQSRNGDVLEFNHLYEVLFTCFSYSYYSVTTINCSVNILTLIGL